jgi:predicted methyltransferase
VRRIPDLMRKASAGMLLVVAAAVAPALSGVDASDVDTALDQILAGAHRDTKNAARDVYRHPKQGLVFFGIRPDMAVVEVWPSGGWWTEILAPLLKDQGRYYAAWYATQAAGTSDFAKEQEQKFDAKLAERPDLYGKVIKTHLLAPEFVDIAPKGSVDLVLTFRNAHNWAKAGNAQVMFKTFYDVLKPGGILGVVDHRARPGTAFQRQIDSGYLTEEYVIGVAQQAGFKLAEKSELNANPKDTTDHPRGVWTLPPTLALGATDRDKYLAIGESDRMTLKFVKPAR